MLEFLADQVEHKEQRDLNEPGDQKSQEQRPPDHASSAQSQVVAPPVNDTGEQNPHAAKERKRLTDKVAGFTPIFEMLLTICAVVGLVLVLIQIYYMGQSNKLTRESNALTARALEITQRAEIAVDQVKTETLAAAGNPLSARVTIRNTGETTATGLRVIAGFAYLPSPIQPNYPMVDNGEVAGSVATLRADGSTEIFVPIADLTEDALQMVRGGKAKLYVFGDATYLNGFGHKRRTRFCAQHESGGQWGQCPNNNEVE